MVKEMEELNRKLVGWSGLKLWINPLPEHYHGLICVDPEDANSAIEVDFPHSLDACIKHLVPKLTGYKIASHSNGIVTAVVYDYSESFKNGYAEAKTSAMAFCLAVEMLADKR